MAFIVKNDSMLHLPWDMHNLTFIIENVPFSDSNDYKYTRTHSSQNLAFNIPCSMYSHPFIIKAYTWLKILADKGVFYVYNKD